MGRWPVLLAVLAGVVTALPFLGKKTRYDENEARSLLNLAAAAYGTSHDSCFNKSFPAHEQHRLLGVMQHECDHLDSICESYVVVSEPLQKLFVVFRGTKTKTQLLLEGWQSINPGVDFFDLGNVNRYFMNAHLVLWPEIEQIIVDPKYKNFPITFTGHSLGGALATLAAARTVRQGYRTGDEVKVVTFGQPRVGSLEFAKNFDKMITYAFRVVFRRDIVPHMPACQKNRTFISETEHGARPCDADALDKHYHQGTEIWYPDAMDHGALYIECTGLPKNEDFSCSDKMKFYYDQTNSYIWDHRHYFGVRVPEYGKTGCDEKMIEGKPGIFENVMCWFSPSPNCEEHILDKTEELPVVPFEIINMPPPVVRSAVCSLTFIHTCFILLFSITIF